MICVAEACNLGAITHGAELRVHFLKSFQKGSTCENLSKKAKNEKRRSEMQVSGLEHPVSLKQVWLLGPFDDALKQAVQQQLDRHPKKPAPKLEVVPRQSQESSWRSSGSSTPT
jgi:hypothetical protein